MTDFYLSTEEMRPFQVLWLTVTLEDCLNVTYLHKTAPQCGLFMVTVAEIFPGALEMDRTSYSMETK